MEMGNKMNRRKQRNIFRSIEIFEFLVFIWFFGCEKQGAKKENERR